SRGIFFVDVVARARSHSLPLHDALPISRDRPDRRGAAARRAAHGWPRHAAPPPPRRGHTADHVRTPGARGCLFGAPLPGADRPRSEEHTSELQSREKLVCRLLLEKKKTT